MMKQYTELDVWLKARELATLCYEVTKTFPKEEVFGLTAQMRRSAVSVPSNIAEGCGRNTSKDTLQFLFLQEVQLMSWKLNFILHLISTTFQKSS